MLKKILSLGVVGLVAISPLMASPTNATTNSVCTTGQLQQRYYRGDKVYFLSRTFANGTINWNGGLPPRETTIAAEEIAGNLPTGSTGSVQSINSSYVQQNGTKLKQVVVRGGKAYVRYIPTDASMRLVLTPRPQWTEITATFYAQNLPAVQNGGISAIQAYTEYTHLGLGGYRSFGGIWIGNKGYMYDALNNTVTIPQREVVSSPAALGIANGTLQTIDGYSIPYTNKYNQAIYVNNRGYMREVPVQNGVMNWAAATPFRLVVDLNTNPQAIPGTGDMKVSDSYISCE